jgi:hypothetical protein
MAHRSSDMYVQVSKPGWDILAHEGSKRPLALFGAAPIQSAVAPVTVVANPLRGAAVIDREGLFIGGLGLWAQGLLCILWEGNGIIV